MTTPSAPDAAHPSADEQTGSGSSDELSVTPPGRRRGLFGLLWAFLRETLIVLGLSIVLFLIAKTWLIASFWIPSDSMNDTLIRNDRVMVSRLTPGPFDLSRGDIVVFQDPAHWLRGGFPGPAAGEADGVGAKVNRALVWVGLLPDDLGNHLVKRAIGLPGDRVTCCSANGLLTVNGAEIQEDYVREGDQPSRIDFDITVPQDKIWVMGDHRSDSADSRYNDTRDVSADQLPTQDPTDPKDHTGYYGSVPIDHVVGKAFAVVWPSSRWAWLGSVPGGLDAVPMPAPAAPAASAAPASSGAERGDPAAAATRAAPAAGSRASAGVSAP